MITNAIVQGEFARTALISTAGFADTLAIGRQNRRHLYRLDLPPKLDPLAPEDRRLEADERLDHQGRVLQSLSDAEIDRLIGALAGVRAEAVADESSNLGCSVNSMQGPSNTG